MLIVIVPLAMLLFAFHVFSICSTTLVFLVESLGKIAATARGKNTFAYVAHDEAWNAEESYIAHSQR